MERRQILCGRRDIELVPPLEPEGAVGDVDAVLPLDGADEHLDLRDLIQLVQPLAAEDAPLPQHDLDDLRAPLREGIALQKGRELQQAEDLLCGGALGVDHHAQPQLLPQEKELLNIFRVAHPRDRVLAAELARDDAAEQVQLVPRRRRDQQVAVLHVRRLLHPAGSRRCRAPP